MCIVRRIYLMTIGDMPLNALEKRHAVMVDLALGIGVPLIVVILMYIPQHCRFMIIQDFGCTFASDNDPISVVLGMGPQSMVSLICTVYSILTIRALYKRYSELDELLPSNTIDKNLYFRVLMVGIISSAILFALTLQWFISNAANINHWPGWKILHTKLSCMELGPSTSNSRRPETFHINLEIARWKFVGNAFALFAFFGVQDYMKYLAIIVHVPCFWGKRTSAAHNPNSVTTKMGPLVFDHNPVRRQLKFLDFSPRLQGRQVTRVITDIHGGLPQTQVSVFSSIPPNSVLSVDHGNECYTLVPCVSIPETAVMGPHTASLATGV